MCKHSFIYVLVASYINLIQECGSWLYGDFDNSEPTQVDELYRGLISPLIPTANNSSSSDGISQHAPGSGPATTAVATPRRPVPPERTTSQMLPSSSVSV